MGLLVRALFGGDRAVSAAVALGSGAGDAAPVLEVARVGLDLAACDGDGGEDVAGGPAALSGEHKALQIDPPSPG